ncbi:hypothetical protein XY58_03970 [Stenotrophomonas maltophilia]|nr:hypothetical protein XY58_03970 [Stenotrophomonas maltophilia]
MRIVYRIKWSNFVKARIGEHDIDFLVITLDPFVKPSDVGRVGDVTLHAHRAMADLFHGLGE